MRPIRRTEHDTRIEIMPMIDVVFLLLTFFIYSMVLMVRAEVLPVPLETYITGTPAEPRQSIAITIAVDGNVYLGQELVAIEQLHSLVSAEHEAKPDAIIYLILEDGEAVRDRGPMLTGIWDQLRANGLEIFLVGAPSQLEDQDVQE